MTPPITAGPSPSASIDTTGATAAVNCALTLTLTDGLNRNTTSSTVVTVVPTPAPLPPVANTGGPYTINVSTTVVTVTVTGAASQCNSGPCTYSWSLACTGAPVLTFTGVTPAPPITAGPSPSASIDTSNKTAAVVCPLTLTVTDSLNRTSSSTSSIIALPPGVTPSNPVANPGGPYTVNVSTAVVTVPVSGAASLCFVQPCSYAWRLTCGSAPAKNFTGVTPSPPITAGPSANASIDTTGATAPVNCSLALSVIDALGNLNSASTSVTAVPPGVTPSPPVANPGGPYALNVTTSVVSVGVSGAASTCGAAPCL